MSDDIPARMLSAFELSDGVMGEIIEHVGTSTELVTFDQVHRADMRRYLPNVESFHRRALALAAALARLEKAIKKME